MKKQRNEKELCEMGEMVYWFSNGETTNPHAAMATLDESGGSRVLSLIVFTPYGTELKQGVKHISVQTSPIDRSRNGFWAWNKNPKVDEKSDIV